MLAQDHPLGALWELADASRHDVTVISTNPERVSNSRFAEFLLAIWLHLKGAIGIVRSRRSDAIVLTKFKTPLLPLLIVLTFPWAKKIFMVVHHTVQQAVEKPWSRPLLRAATKLGYGLLVFESAEALRGGLLGRVRVIEIPEPGPHSSFWSDRPPAGRSADRITVGVVGERRAEKGNDQLIRQLKRLQAAGDIEIEVLVAATNLADYPGDVLEGVRTLETPDMASYCRALRQCDVVAFNHADHRYHNRTSGVLSDAVIFGCYVVAPDYPLFRRQITNPTRVGATFVEIEALDEALADVLKLRESGTDPFTDYQRLRLPETLAAEFDGQLESLR